MRESIDWPPPRAAGPPAPGAQGSNLQVDTPATADHMPRTGHRSGGRQRVSLDISLAPVVFDHMLGTPEQST